MATTVPFNVWVRGHGWFGPSYPDNGDPPGWGEPPADGQGDGQGEGGMPDLDELDPDDPSRRPADEVEQRDGPEPPPRAGKGSGTAAWRAYAAQHGVAVAEDADRGDIIAALDAAHVRTE